MNTRDWVENNTIHRIWAGSRLYGTQRPDSDWDERGVCLMPPEALIGLQGFEQLQGPGDRVIYGLTKFFRLALGCNPNILDILFAPPDTWRCKTVKWLRVYAHRHLFLSQRVRKTFSGYALGQLKRIKRSRGWLLDPPDHKPTVEEFGGQLVAFTSSGKPENLFLDICKQREYEAAVKRWKRYQAWLENRNPARAELERKFGYDTKHAAHLVRLLRQAVNILRTGDYNPCLQWPDLKPVLEVLHGEWEYEALIEWAEMADEQIATTPSDLPDKPDTRKVEELLMELNMRTLGNGGRP